MRPPCPIWRAESKNGALVLPRSHSFADYLRTIEGPVDLIVRQQHTKRSLEANRYYWGIVLVVFSEHCGYEPEELHEVLKHRFLSIQGGSTANLDRRQFSAYIERVIRLAAEMGCVVPPSDAADV